MAMLSALLIFLLVLLMLTNLGIGLCGITIGTRNLTACNAEPFLPIALLVSGGLSALLAVCGIWDSVRAHQKYNRPAACQTEESQRLVGQAGGHGEGACMRFLAALCWVMNTAALAWAGLSLFLVLRTRAVYTWSLASAPDYCEPALVQNSIVLVPIGIGTAAIVGIVNIVCYLIN